MTSDWVWWNAANQTSPVLSLVTYYIPNLETCKLHSRPSAALESSAAANNPSIRTLAERRRLDGQTNLLRSRSAVDGHPHRFPGELLPCAGSGPNLLLSERRHFSQRQPLLYPKRRLLSSQLGMSF